MTSATANLQDISLNHIIDIARQAGDAIMTIYQKDFVVQYKANQSPITEADIKANEIICSALKKQYPNIPILSEENKQIDYQQRKNWQYYWCIDPIDGTKEFINKNHEWTINIALIYQNTPVLGVVYAPALSDMYSAKKGEGAFKNGQKLPIFANHNPKQKLTVVASKSHLSEQTQDFIQTLETDNIEQISKGSSLKFCMVAEGIADIYPRLAPTMEWDSAAAHTIVLEAGKKVIQYDNQQALTYNKKNLRNPWFVVQ